MLLIVFMAFNFTGCGNANDNESVEMRQTKQTNKILNEMNRQIGLPNIVNFKQKKTLKMVYEQADREDLICYVYLQSKYSGKLTYIGKSIGYGVPYSAQFTNPMKVIDYARGLSGIGYRPGTIPQADPNGIYMPTSSSATWLMMIDPRTNKPRPVYIEPEIVVSPFKLN